jgi:hypothetical protein
MDNFEADTQDQAQGDGQENQGQEAKRTDQAETTETPAEEYKPKVEEYFPGVPQRKMTDEERAAEHEWQLRSNPAYNGEFAPEREDEAATQATEQQEEAPA